MRKFALLGCLFFHGLCIFGQREFKNQVTLITENDNYMLNLRDGYYTNGIFMEYDRVSRFRGLLKSVSGYRLGQMIFISESFRNSRAERIDRPISGYLFLEKNYRFFFRKGHILKTYAALGGTGKYSLGRKIQSWYHNVMDLPVVKSWPYELNGEIALQMGGQFYFNLVPAVHKKRTLDIMPIARMNVGNAFTNASAAALLRFGNFEANHNSSFFHSALGERKDLRRRAEIFIYYQPELLWQLYNATVEGPLFRKDKGPFVSEIRSWVYQQSFGAHFSEGRISLNMNFSMKRKEAESMRQTKERFAALSIGYRF